MTTKARKRFERKSRHCVCRFLMQSHAIIININATRKLIAFRENSDNLSFVHLSICVLSKWQKRCVAALRMYELPSNCTKQCFWLHLSGLKHFLFFLHNLELLLNGLTRLAIEFLGDFLDEFQFEIILLNQKIKKK